MDMNNQLNNMTDIREKAALQAILIYLRHFYRCLVFVMLSVTFIHSAYASTFEVYVIAEEKHHLHQNFTDNLKSSLAKRISENDNISITIHTSDNWSVSSANNANVVVILGTRLGKNIVSKNITSPIIYSLVPRSFYEDNIASTEVCARNKCTAIFIDQPISRTINLVRLALPDIMSIGSLTSEHSHIDVSKIQKFADKHSLKLQTSKLHTSENLVFRLSELLQKSDSLLTFPDPVIYNSRTAQNILLTAYRHRKPVIGYSKSFIKAGALVGVYSEPSQLAHQTADLVTYLANNKTNNLPKPQHPKYYTVSVNYLVAKSLGIKITSENKLKAALKASENEKSQY